MKANRLARDEGGDFGIGTMIIFIAMIIVAVVAATVIISTMNSLQGTAYNTAKDATQMVSSGLDIRMVVMDRTGGLDGSIPYVGSFISRTTQNLPLPLGMLESRKETAQKFIVTLQLRAGSVPIDLDKALISIITPAQSVTYSGSESLDTVRKFDGVTALRDNDNSIGSQQSLNNLGDVADVVLDVRDLGIGPGDRFEIRIVPDVGGLATTAQVTMPLSYANDAATVALYP
jgi:flagellin FlaB